MEGNKSMRLVKLLGVAATYFVVLLVIFLNLFSHFPLFEDWDFTLSLILATVATVALMPFWVIDVRAYSSVIIINRLTGKIYAGPPGFNGLWPWDRLRKILNTQVEKVTSGDPEVEEEQPEKYNLKDGGVLFAKWIETYQVGDRPEDVETYGKYDKRVVARNLSDIMYMVLTELFQNRTVSQVLKNVSGMNAAFRAEVARRAPDILTEFGVRVGIPKLSEVSEDPTTQEARAALFELGILDKYQRKLKGTPDEKNAARIFLAARKKAAVNFNINDDNIHFDGEIRGVPQGMRDFIVTPDLFGRGGGGKGGKKPPTPEV